MKLISIIMGTNNDELYIRKAIDSILSQSYKNFELIIVNDASTDNTKKIIKSYTDERIVYIENDYNIGLTASLNKGLVLAKGKYIARMDADDICVNTRLEEELQIITEKSVLGVFTAGLLIDEDDNIIGKRNYKNGIIDLNQMKSNNFLIHSSALLDKEVLIKNGGYDKNLLYAQDYDLWLRLLKEGEFYYLDKALIKYRINSNKRSIYKAALQTTNSIFPRLRLYLEQERSIFKSIKFYMSIIKTLIYLDCKERKNIKN